MKFFLLFFFLLSPFVILSAENNNLEKDIYNNCEDTQDSFEDIDKLSKTDRVDRCRELLNIKGEYTHYNPQYLAINNSKQYHLGVVFSHYRLENKYAKKGYWEGALFNSFYVQAIYFEYRLAPIVYLGARIGLLKTRWAGNGEYFESYISFNPLFMLKYVNFNILFGALGYNMDDNYSRQLVFSVNFNLGFKLANAIRINFEFGSYDHYGFIFGVLF